jgi:hypothetical protein
LHGVENTSQVDAMLGLYLLTQHKVTAAQALSLMLPN